MFLPGLFFIGRRNRRPQRRIWLNRRVRDRFAVNRLLAGAAGDLFVLVTAVVSITGALAAPSLMAAGDASKLDPTDIDRPDFNRDVRPILAKHCFTCHGPDDAARQADLRLDTEAGSREDRGGYQVIAPSDPDHSELLVRITSDDADLRMPPSDSSEPLADREIEILRAWVKSGGQYNVHWSFRPTANVPVPTVEHPEWCRGPIDRFVLHHLEQSGLQPGPAADRTALIRRVYLDLLGTTPTPEEVERFTW